MFTEQARDILCHTETTDGLVKLRDQYQRDINKREGSRVGLVAENYPHILQGRQLVVASLAIIKGELLGKLNDLKRQAEIFINEQQQQEERERLD